MATYILDGEMIGPGRPFTHNGLQYQANWTELASPEEIAAIGMVEYIEPPRPDSPPVDPYLVDPYLIPPLSPRQIRQALTRAGLRDAVESAVASGDRDLKDWWEFSTSFEINNEQVTSMAAALGVSADQLKDLWSLGAGL
jgi:hypothetical protein